MCINRRSSDQDRLLKRDFRSLKVLAQFVGSGDWYLVVYTKEHGRHADGRVLPDRRYRADLRVPNKRYRVGEKSYSVR
jgi:hypothetical protein